MSHSPTNISAARSWSQLPDPWRSYSPSHPATGARAVAAGLGLTIGTPMEPRNLNRHFEGLRVTAELPDVRLHDLRHTGVSLLLDLGTPPHVVQAIARHAHVDITMAIYANTNLDAMRQALDAIEWEDL